MSRKKKSKYTLRSDGRLQTKITIDGVVKTIYGKTDAEIDKKIKALTTEKVYTFAEVAELWQEDHDKEIEVYTRNCYVAPKKDVVEYFGKRLAKDITPEDIDAFMKLYVTNGCARQTAKLRLIVLRQIFDYGRVHCNLHSNPCTAVKLPKGLRTSTRQLPTSNDIAAIENNTDSNFGLFLFTLYNTGLRREEALALTGDDIDRKNKTIRIHNVIIFEDYDSSVIRPYTKSEAGERIVPLLPQLEARLPKTKGFIFNVDGEPYTKRTYDSAYKRFKRATGITVTAHQLRHEYATRLFDADIDVKIAQQVLGHSRYEITEDVYTHIRAEKQKIAHDEISYKLSNGVKNGVNPI